MTLTAEQLYKIGIGPKRTAASLDKLNECLEKYEINTRLRVCHFLAQILHESGAFRYVEELASGKAYEGRKDLGNTEEGDGVRFKGRGMIQLTGRSNYKKYGEAIGEDLIGHPEKVATEYFADVAGWYWKRKGLNHYADRDDITSITKIVNGALNGFEDRQRWLALAKANIV